MKKIIFVLLIVSGCATQNFFEFTQLKRTPIKDDYYIVPKAATSAPSEYNINRWMALIFISNNYTTANIFNIPNELCPKSDVITNASLTYSFFMIPVLWIDMDHKYAGNCHE